MPTIQQGLEARARAEAKDRAREQRRKTRERVQNIREKITSESGTKPAFDYEMLATMARNENSATLMLILFTSFVFAGSTFWFPTEQMLGWFLATVTLKLVVVVLCRRFLDADPRQVSLKSWQLRIGFAQLLHSFSWGTLALMDFGNHGFSESDIFIFAVLLLVMSIRTMLSSTVLLSMRMATLPLTACLIASYIGMMTPLAWMLCIVIVSAQGYFIVLSRNLNQSSLRALSHRAEKDALIAELEQEKLKADSERRRAENANEAKSRFLATMSHELRTPLNAILGFSEVMKGELLGPLANETYKSYCGDIHKSGQHLLHLINEILDLSRIEAGRYELNEEAVCLGAIMEESHHLLSMRIREKGLIVEEKYEDNMPRLWADERAVRQICLNLLSNAIKFTPQGGTLHLTVGLTAGGGQYLSVRDTGPGIPENEIPTVLASFGQGSLAHKTAEQGAGLGLPIVAGLAKMHGAHFDFRSRVRVGTEVTVAFPKARVVEALAPVRPEKDKWARYARKSA